MDVRETLSVDRSSGRTDKAPIIFIHGALDAGRSFQRVRRRMEDYRTVAYDRRGYRSSRHLGSTLDLADHAADLAAVIGDEPAVLVGHSIGGVVAMATATNYPDKVRSVVIYETPMAWQPWWETFAGGNPERMLANPGAVAKNFYVRLMGEHSWERLGSAGQQMRIDDGPALVGDLIMVGDTRPFDPEVMTAPVLVGVGEQANAKHFRGAQEHAWLFGQEHPTVVEGAGHGVHLSHPDGFARLIRSSL
ncbi:MAG: alpha/beta fold hydrolase [Acidimicrobiales bacterium]